MKIGIDAKWYYNGPPSGVVVVKNLVNSLIEINDGNQLHIFLSKRDQNKAFPYQDKYVHVHYIWDINSLISNVVAMPIYCIGLNLDVVIFQNYSPLISKYRRISYVHDVIYLSNPEYFSLSEKLYYAPIKFLARRAHRICTISESEKRRLVKYNLGCNGNIDVIHHGIRSDYKPKEKHEDKSLKEVTAKYNLPDQYLLYVGRLNIRKNILNLMTAIKYLRNKTIKLVLAGTYDWKMFDVVDRARQLGIADRIIMTKYVEDEHLPILYALSTVVCFVSYEEGFGLPALEAMASGVPVVVADASSLPEVCGAAGNYIDPHSSENIAEMIDSLLDNENLYNEGKRL